jgi:putative glycosyltransferase (TIGR04372 family)
MLKSNFLNKQCNQIKEGGWMAVRRKARIAIIRLVKFPIYLFGCILSLPLVLFIRLIRPFKLVRFGPVRSDVIGHMVCDPEYYLCEREIEGCRATDCFYYETRPLPNEQWGLMLQRQLRINSFFYFLDKTNLLIPGGKTHHKIMCPTGSRDIKGFVAKTKPHITFTLEEDRQGRLFLEELGMKSSDKFVCLIVRDSAYKEKLQKWGNRDWSYHNYRDSDIDTYNETALTLAEKGYWVFRMGKMVHKPLKAFHPHILDYATSEYKSDFLDLWLMANCFFCISTATGIDVVAGVVFRRPVAYVNAVSLGFIVPQANRDSIWLPKKVIWTDSKKQLTLEEQIETGAIGFLLSKEFVKAGVELIDNSPEEITKTVLEIEAKITELWKLQPKDNDRQKKFWNILQTWERFPELHGQTQSKLSDTFLRDNHSWFLS